MRWPLLLLALILLIRPAFAGLLTAEELALRVEPPFELGEKVEGMEVWTILDRTGVEAGWIFETEPLAPIPGFSGAPINMLVTVDKAGMFLGAELLSHNEPVFVSGLGEAPFHEFLRQYRGLSIFSPISVGVPYGDAGKSSTQVALDGVSKATASVRIAHESILAAALAVARNRLRGLAGGPALRPSMDLAEQLDWQALVERGLVTRRTITNGEIQAAFAGTLFEDDDPLARDDPDVIFLDLHIIDIGPASIARAVLDAETFSQWQGLLAVATHDEPILLLANGRHGLVSGDFVRNTAPDLLSATQDGFPVALRDADIEIGLAGGVPPFEHRMMLRSDRRLGFDPTRPWELAVRFVREHGMFLPEIGTVDIAVAHVTDAAYYDRDETAAPLPLWQQSLLARWPDLASTIFLLVALGGVLAFRMNALAGHRHYRKIRLAILAVTVLFIGYHAQAQLSIVTPLAMLRAPLTGQSMGFLLHDPVSLLIWIFVALSLVLWGRGFFCGWLCPFGAMQEFADKLGRLLRLPRFEPRGRIDDALRLVKYAVLALLAVTALAFPLLYDSLVEIEPFKTAITVAFRREWPFVLYALFWLLAGLVLFKPFCRWICPLGALLAIGGWLRQREWIDRRTACGSPCQLCRVRCSYGAIRKSGEVRYDECFQCLDCVTIHDDARQCVPLVLAAQKQAGAGKRSLDTQSSSGRASFS
ncbi:MAG: 4Fe-4S binding protein [Geminicoccaceae bacterium]